MACAPTTAGQAARHHAGGSARWSPRTAALVCVAENSRWVLCSLYPVWFFGCMPDGSITTFSDVLFWPLLPNPDDIRIADIAHALSQQCRFAGHTRTFYSVAEHSVRVSQLCRPEDALWGLLHDASEAFLTDVPAPLKELPQFEAYRAAERRLQRTIATRFGVAPEQPESVGDADRSILRVEIRDLLTSINASQSKRAPQKDKLAITAPWPPRVAKARFLSRFRELCRKV